MNRSFRGSAIGLLSGAIANTALIALTAKPHGMWSLLLGCAIGVGYSGAARPARRAYAENPTAGGSLTVPLSCLASAIAVPLLLRQTPVNPVSR
jgi:hypothetical protein